MNQIEQSQSDRIRARSCPGGARLESRRFALAAVAVAAASAGYAAGASAQQDAPGVGVLEEIVVTARRRDEDMQEVPIAVTALSGEFLREQNIGELADLATHVPSMGVSVGGTTTNAPLVSLRGQRPSEVLITLDPAVPVYFADVVVSPSQGTNLAMYDLANVQVLKGPQGMLFGRNSTGGALLFTPRRPGEELGGYLQAKVGDYNLYSLEGAVDLPVNDNLQFRLSGRSLDRDGYQSNVAGNALRGDDEFWDEDSVGVRLGMTLNLGERFRSLTTLAFDENDMLARVPTPQVFNPRSQVGSQANIIFNGAAGIGGPEIDNAIARQRQRDWNETETDLRGTEDVENWFAANTSEFEFTDSLTLKNIFGYRELNMTTQSDVDGMALPMYGGRTSKTEPVTLNPVLGAVDTRQYSDELQLLGTGLDDRLEWILGGYWFRMEGSQTNPAQIIGANPEWPDGPPPAGVSSITNTIAQNGFLQDSPNGEAENEAYAVFGEASYAFSDRWSLSVGTRGSWDDRSVTVHNRRTNFATQQLECNVRDENNVLLPNSACERHENEQFDRQTWRAILNFTPRDAMLMYASVATGYRTGGFNLRGTDNVTLQPFDEENVITYEFGHKSDWQLGELATVRTNLAVYLQTYEDIQKTQGTIVDGVFGTTTINVAEAEIKGAELDVAIVPTENLTLSLAWSYVDAGYNEWDYPAEGRIFDLSDAPFVYIPEHSLTSSINYTLPLEPSLGEVSLMASVYWQDDVATHAEFERFPTLGWSPEVLAQVLDTVFVDDYAVWNFRVDWRGVLGSSFDVAAFVNNAADEAYQTGGLNVADSLGVVDATYGPPRTYGASLQWNF
jgi:iron complex outermembrane recepter protein